MKKLLLLAAITVLASGCSKKGPGNPLGLLDLSPNVSEDPNAGVIGVGEPITLVVWGQSNARYNTDWNRVANGIIRNTGRPVNVVNVAVSNTDSNMWTSSPVLRGPLMAAVSLPGDYYIVCIQGEGDANTSAQSYFNNMSSIYRELKALAPTARMMQALCSYQPFGVGDPRGGQQMLFSAGLVERGPDVDRYRTAQYSKDNGLHFNSMGGSLIADDFVNAMF
jgi:hypothetical protein